jgi:hypothetical protein
VVGVENEADSTVGMLWRAEASGRGTLPKQLGQHTLREVEERLLAIGCKSPANRLNGRQISFH